MIAAGCMRLSTELDRDDTGSIQVLHAAFDAGVTFLDTADAYCLTDEDIGHNERLIARALKAWGGDPASIIVATKGGMTRPEGRWEPDGRAKHLAAACERSCRALDVAALDLYQLHVVDPRVPLTTSVRAMAGMKRSGVIKSIGLCNVTVGQIEEARRIVDIDVVQNELSVWNDSSILSGVAGHCLTNGIRFLAYRPFGGRKAKGRTASDPALLEVAARHDSTPFEIALAWLSDLDRLITPLPGVTQVAQARAAARGQRMHLVLGDRLTLDARFPHGRLLRERNEPRITVASRSDAEVVLIMGLPGAGKSTLAGQYVEEGYVRLNRDEAGGSLRELLPALERSLSDGSARIVLDNTYTTRRSRAEVLQVAARHGVPVTCVSLTTTIDQAQVNAVTRIVERYGRLPDDAEWAALRGRDVAAFLPTVQFRYQRELEPPDASEGFSRIEERAFEPQTNSARQGRAVIVWCDEPAILETHATLLRAHQESGAIVAVMSWQPGIEAGVQAEAVVRGSFVGLADRAGLRIDLSVCPHAAGPPRCWCRKPLPGLGVALIHRHRLDPARCLYVGSGPQDPGFARKLGFKYFNGIASLPEPVE
jgi:aryl-alcohol dehydrogenase-like predicted oxidoreductase/predicted kinase